ILAAARQGEASRIILPNAPSFSPESSFPLIETISQSHAFTHRPKSLLYASFMTPSAPPVSLNSDKINGLS
ncbi:MULTISPECIES: hypothetical protein, partial [unclassified Cronobacter]|uniref:hypothetical protein n=1 Tax=unclassified Cronobacter TaxID=2649764 RepID=UPI001C879FC2